jgi:hypothetical protein
MKMELAECYETSAYKIQTPENHPKEGMKMLWYFNEVFFGASSSTK